MVPRKQIQMGCSNAWLIAMAIMPLLSSLVRAQLSPSSASPTSSPPNENAGSQSWDYLLFVQTWPGTACADSRCTSEQVPHRWTVHGLWPNRNDGGWPEYCSSSFNRTQIADLVPRLEKVWVNLWHSNNDVHFWRHEWQKHGSCAKSVDRLDDEHAYFTYGLLLSEKVNVMAALASKNIVPSLDAMYHEAEIVDAIKTTFGVIPRVACYTSTNGTHMLQNIMLCINKDLQMMDCPMKGQPLEANAGCNPSHLVAFPLIGTA
jgi:ribonuclease T2